MNNSQLKFRKCPKKVNLTDKDEVLVSTIHSFVDSLELDAILATYKGKGIKGGFLYDPRNMLKIILLSYTLGIYSAREIEHLLHSDSLFQSVSGNYTPHHSTISRFIREHLPEKELDSIFIRLKNDLIKKNKYNKYYNFY